MGGSWTHEVVERVNARLAEYFEAKLQLAGATSPDAPELVDAIAQLTLRGGKRLRPLALHAGYCATRSPADVDATCDAGCALELLQTYLLIQDDWMDDDAERRGGPAVHVAMSQSHGDVKLGAALAILAGDLAAGFAWELLRTAPFPDSRLREALALFGEMHFEVVCGQQLDLLHHPDVALTHHLKSGSYTVRGPLQLGALLGDATPAQREALEHFGQPLGVAFQLRDDLLGAFGDHDAVGKPIGNDLRAGKNTSLVVEARRLLEGAERDLFESVLGNPDADAQALARATDLLLRCGARERVEARLSDLSREASAAIEGADLEPAGLDMLRQLIDRLGTRDR